MARKNTAKKRYQKVMAREMDANSAISPDAPMLYLSGWSGADPSQRRGYILWHGTGDTKWELPPWADQELRRKSHWAYANVPIARRIIRGHAQLIGWQRPQPATADRAWNRLAWANFNSLAGKPAVYDAKAELDFYQAQVAVNITRGKDGRCLGVLTESPGGSARMAYYEAHQIRGFDGKEGWQGGIYRDKFGRKTAFALANEGSSESTVVPGRDAIMYETWDAFGRPTGVPMLAAGLAHLQDTTEIDAQTKHRIKINSEIGIVVETDSGPAIQLPGGLGLVGVPGYQTVEVEAEQPSSDPDTPPRKVVESKKVSWESVIAQGGIPALAKGQKVKVVYDDRPGPNLEAFNQRLIDLCVFGCTDLPPAAIYYLGDLKGPGVRYSMEQIRRYVMLRHRQMAVENQRYYVYHISKEIKMGRLPQGPDGWWNDVTWIGMPDPTIDSGRDGALSITKLKCGLTTWAREWQDDGEFGDDMIEQRIDEYARALSYAQQSAKTHKVEFALDDVLPGLKSAA